MIAEVALEQLERTCVLLFCLAVQAVDLADEALVAALERADVVAEVFLERKVTDVLGRVKIEDWRAGFFVSLSSEPGPMS